MGHGSCWWLFAYLNSLPLPCDLHCLRVYFLLHWCWAWHITYLANEMNINECDASSCLTWAALNVTGLRCSCDCHVKNMLQLAVVFSFWTPEWVRWRTDWMITLSRQAEIFRIPQIIITRWLSRSNLMTVTYKSNNSLVIVFVWISRTRSCT